LDNIELVDLTCTPDIISSSKPKPNRKLLWDKADLCVYKNNVDSELSKITVPHEALLCRDMKCKRHHDAINEYYVSIVRGLCQAAHCIPSTKSDFHKHWWSPELDELKTMCIDATTLWRSHGCPRSGPINTNRLQCKYQYKVAIKAAIAES